MSYLIFNTSGLGISGYRRADSDQASCSSQCHKRQDAVPCIVEIDAHTGVVQECEIHTR